MRRKRFIVNVKLGPVDSAPAKFCCDKMKEACKAEYIKFSARGPYVQPLHRDRNQLVIEFCLFCGAIIQREESKAPNLMHRSME